MTKKTTKTDCKEEGRDIYKGEELVEKVNERRKEQGGIDHLRENEEK